MSSFESDPQFEQLKSRLQQNPDSLLFARVAEGLLNRGQVEEAVRVCEEGIRKHPYYVTGHMVLGKCYLQKKLFDLAEKEFKRVLLFDPKYIAAHKFYGDLMREVGWENTCEMSYRKILQIDPLDRNVREMIETLERVKPKEQEVVTPQKESIGNLPGAEGDFAGGVSAEPKEPSLPESQAAEEPFQVGEYTPAEPINIDDDLFADVSTAPPSEELSEPQAEISEDDTSVSGILEDIFEEEPSSPEEHHDLEELSIEDEPAAETEKEQVAEGIIPEEESKSEKADTGNSDPMADLEKFEEETLELDQLEGLEQKAETETHLKSDDLENGMGIFPSSEGEAEEEGQDLFAALEEPEKSPETEIEAKTSPWDFDLEGETAEEIPEETQTESFAAAELPATEQEPEKGVQEEKRIHVEHKDEPAPQQLIETPKAAAVTQDAGPGRKEAETAEEKTPFNIDREKIVTPTLGEIYAAQGQYAKAMNVFEVLLKKDPANVNYREKIDMLKKRMEESQDGE